MPDGGGAPPSDGGGAPTPDAGPGGPPACSQGQTCSGADTCTAMTPQGMCVATCKCANGTYACGACQDGAGADGGGGTSADAASMCAPGLTCAAGATCKDLSAQGTCEAICSCDNGFYQCAPCGGGGADAGAAPVDAGASSPDAGAPSFACQLNGACPKPGATCMIGSPGNGFQCTCEDNAMLSCVHWDAPT